MSTRSRLLLSLGSLALALFFGGLIILILGDNPLEIYYKVLAGSFGSLSNFMGVLSYTTPLIMTGLAAVVAFRGGVFNIGGEGQLLFGSLMAVIVGLKVDMPWPFPLLLALLAGFLGGAIWALIPTALLGRNMTSLFVGTIMMNSIGSLVTEYLVKYHFLRPNASTTETAVVNAGAILPRFHPNTQLNYGIFLALLLVLVVSWFLYRTPTGFSVRAVGMNPRAAMQAGVNVYSRTLITMAISGGICGLAGAVQCLGIYNRWMMGFSPGYGWDGITVATLAGLSPVGVVVTGLFFGMLRSASISMNVTTKIPIDVIAILQGLVVIFVASPTLWTALKNVGQNWVNSVKGLFHGAKRAPKEG